MTPGSCATAAIPIDQLAEKSSFLEVTYLLIYGELPTADQLGEFDQRIRRHTLLHEDLKTFFNGFPRDAHPMPVLSSAVSALSTFYQDSLDPFDEEQVEISTLRLLAKLPTIAAYAYKKSVGQPFLYPDNSCGLVENFLRMTFGFPAEPYDQDPDLVKALDMLFILHADHEQNCSTSTVRLVGSSHANLFASVSAGINALFGPLHGGANQSVLEMLEAIQRDGGDIPRFVERVKNKEPGVKLMGFGHRVYKNYDPRAAIVKSTADTVLDKLGGNNELLDLARQLEEIALKDDYFIQRKLYPNVDFYTGLIYRAMGFPTRMFTVLFALGRLPGWIAQWREMIADPAPRSAARGSSTPARPSGTTSPSTSADLHRPPGRAALRSWRAARPDPRPRPGPLRWVRPHARGPHPGGPPMAEPPGDDVLVVPPIPLASGSSWSPRTTARRSASPSVEVVISTEDGERAPHPPRRTATAPGGPPDGMTPPGHRRRPPEFTLTRRGESASPPVQRTPSARRYEAERSGCTRSRSRPRDDETAGGRCSACTTHALAPAPPAPPPGRPSLSAAEAQALREALALRAPLAAGQPLTPAQAAALRAAAAAAARTGPPGPPPVARRRAGRPPRSRPAAKRPADPPDAGPTDAAHRLPWSTRLRRGRPEHPAAAGRGRPGAARRARTASGSGPLDATALALTAQSSLLEDAGRYRALEQEVARARTAARSRPATGEQAALGRGPRPAAHRRVRPPPTCTGPPPQERYPLLGAHRARRRRHVRRPLRAGPGRPRRPGARPATIVRAERSRRLPRRRHRPRGRRRESAVDARPATGRRRPGDRAVRRSTT